MSKILYNNIKKEPTGFLDPSAVVINYDPATQKVTLTGTITAYYRGTNIAVANPTFVSGWLSAAHSNVTGHIYFLYYNGTAFVWADNTFPGFDMVLIAIVNYGATNKYCIRECHGFMPWEAHKEFHETIGTYKTSGGTFPSNQYVLNSTTAANRRIDIDQTTITDEDCPSVLPALTSKSYTIYNLTGASVGAYTLASGDIIPLLTNNPYYNTFNTPNWGQTLMPTNSVASVWVYAVPVTASATSQAYRYLFVQPQWVTLATNGSAGAIATAVASENLRLPSELNLGTLSIENPELIAIGRIIIDFTNNWRLQNVSVLSGNKFSQVGSPSGNFLSSVTTDATLTGNGTVTSPLAVAIPYVNPVSGTINEIGYFDSTSTVKSLTTATYPSLTELSYVKGVTSAIQTQINAKGVGDMLLGTAQSVTETKTFTKDKLLVKGTSTGTTNLTTANTSATSYTATFPAKDGTVAMTTDIVSQVEDNITDGHTTIAPSGNAVFDALALKLPLAGGTMSGNIVMGNGGTIGQAAGPLIAFDDTNNYLEITGANVGIGTTAPLSQVNIVKATAPTTIDNSNLYLRLGKEENGANSYRMIGFGYSAAETYPPLAIGFKEIVNSGSTSGNFVVASRTATDAALTEHLTVTSDGFVGIGTSTPGTKLDIPWGGYTAVKEAIRIGADVGNNSTRTNSTRKYGVLAGYHYTNAEESVGILSYDSAATENIINIGVGSSGTNAPTKISFFTAADTTTTSGTEKLTIASNGIVTMSAYGAGAATFSAAGVISSVSDERLKDIQSDFTPGLKEILQINPINYKWKKEAGMGDEENIYAGFSAQNVIKYIPEAVGKGTNGFYSFSDRPITAALVNCIKELKAEIDELRAELKLERKDYTVESIIDEARIVDSAKCVKKEINEVEEVKEEVK